MGPERWRQVKEVYCAALELGKGERERMLGAVCQEDADLLQQVESLLQYQGPAAEFLEVPALESSARTVESSAAEKGISEQVRAGEVLSHYKILEKIGSGGMGVVYKAQDLRLHRFVALKFLSPEVRGDGSALLRFEREAQAASALNHPNICTIYDIEADEGQAFVAMEFLDGMTVADAIAAAPMPVEQLLDAGTQIAEGLSAAHGSGIIHRDIKPANIFVMQSGRVKILDFGIAKLVSPRSQSEAPSTLTAAGMAVGTIEYMSPEQALGKELDARSDLFSFGIVLYEMATGRGPFRGETAAASFDAILNKVPPPARGLNPAIPAELEAILSRALEKKPELRYQRAAEMLADLRALQEHAKVLPHAVAGHKPVRRKAAYWGAAGLLTLAIILAVRVAPKLGREGTQAPPSQPRYKQLTNFADAAVSPALSPDGRMLAFLRQQEPYGASELYLKLLPNGEPVRLTHDGHEKVTPVFTPDGSRIAYTREEGWNWQTWTVPVPGGTPSELLPNASGLTWVGPHQIMFSELLKDGSMKLVTAGENREDERDIYVPAGPEGMAHRSHLSPDSQWVLIVEMGATGWLPCRLVPFSGNSKGRVVGPNPSQCTATAWSPDGKWMYFAADTGGGSHLWRQQFPNGIPEQITSGATEEDGLAIAPDGKSLITSVGTQHGAIRLHDENGEPRVTSQEGAFLPAVSPDGKQVYYLVDIGGASGQDSGELWSTDLQSGQEEHLLPGFMITRYRISADGREITFAKAEAGRKSSIWTWPLDRHSAPQRLAGPDAYRPMFLNSDRIVFQCGNYICAINRNGTAQQRVVSRFGNNLINVSPDGRWIVAEDLHNGVVAYPVNGGAWKQLCAKCAVGTLGRNPPYISWSLDGRWIYLPFRQVSGANHMRAQTLVVPLRPGEVFPSVSGELINNRELLKRPGSRLLNTTSAFPGRGGSTYTFWRPELNRNLYRISLP